MFDLPPIPRAAVTGFVWGFLLSVPVGPINMSIVNEGARRGLKWAAMIGAGATVMEVIYCGLAFTGFASFAQGKLVSAAMELFSFVFLLYLGLRFLLVKTMPTPLGRAADRFGVKVEERFHPHSAFWIGFVRCMGNPGVFLFWIMLAANFISRGWVEPTWPSKFACLGGVTVGVGLWFIGLSWLVSRGHQKFSETTLVRMERGSGVGLLVLALIHGGHIIWRLAHHYPG